MKKKQPATNRAAELALAGYQAALYARPVNEAEIARQVQLLAATIAAEAAAGATATGYEVQLTNRDGTPAVTRNGQPVTSSGMKPGTPFALVARPAGGQRLELCKVWPCGSIESAGPACFSL